MAGEIISECRATSNRNGGRHHRGFAGDFPRNPHAIRYGLRTIATLVFVLSAAAGGLFGFTAKLPHIAVLGLSVAAGFIVQGNFSNLTSGRARRCRSAVPRGNDRVLFLHRLCGWVPRDPPVRRHARPVRGGTSQLAAWIVSFCTCGLACLAGASATIFLPRNIWQRWPH